MINIEVKRHNNFTLEFKSGISISSNHKDKDWSEFMINTWFYVPSGLGISPQTYKKEDFYKEVKTYLRLITPIYTLDEILEDTKGPFERLKHAFEINTIDKPDDTDNLIYQIKMFVCILKSALRREVQTIALHPNKDELNTFVERIIVQMSNIRDSYRSFSSLINTDQYTPKQKSYYKFGDEFLGNLIQQYCFLGLRILKDRHTVLPSIQSIKKLIGEEDQYKKSQSFLITEENDNKNNRLVITQRNILKKLMESDLFLHIKKKEDGQFVKQFFYALAAATAMLFATIISFIATQRYGNFTFDLLIVLVISYVFKDRIKEMMRYYFSNSLSKKYFDHKLNLNIRNQEIGEFKEAFNFTTKDKIPKEIANLRMLSPMVQTESEIFGEEIFQYRKHVKLSHTKLEKYKEYKLSGINDISRFEFTNYTTRMENSETPLFTINDSIAGFHELEGSRVYPIYILFNCISEDEHFNKGYRILLNREGITDITELRSN